MTFAIFIIIFLGLFITALNWLPDASSIGLPLTNSINLLVANARAWNSVFPVTELLTCFGVIMGVEISIWIWKAIKWVLHIIRGTGS